MSSIHIYVLFLLDSAVLITIKQESLEPNDISKVIPSHLHIS